MTGLPTDFIAHFAAGLTFPPMLNNQNDWISISRYQAHMDKVIDILLLLRLICLRSASTSFNKGHHLIPSSVASGPFIFSDLDRWA